MASDADRLWIDSYQGEVLGEALFGLMATCQDDPARRHQLEVLTLLERSTKELAEPVLERRGLGPGDTAASLAAAKEMADGLEDVAWEDFLGSIEPVTVQFLAMYHQLVALATDDGERDVAERYVAHEEALVSFARRALGQEEGPPLERILDLPHVAAAAGT
jgi:hypothetical protein